MRPARVLVGVVTALLGVVPVLASAPAAAASGACQDSQGVTVVVDLSDLGGGVLVGCAGTGPMNGLEALQRAGFSVAGTGREGLAFVCRIDGRPATDEKLTVAGRAGYRELCATTPPSGAYWAYWYAGPDGQWRYATTGPSGHEAIAGGLEGWRFELNRPQGRLLPPVSVDVTPTSASPSTGSSTGSSTGAVATVPASGAGRETGSGSPWPTVLAVVGASALAAGGGAAAWRRSRSR